MLRAAAFVLLVALAAVVCARDCTLPYSDVGYNAKKRNSTMECFFAQYDSNHDGKIEEHDYKRFTDSLSFFYRNLSPGYSRVIGWCDCDGDNKISRQDAHKAWNTCFKASYEVDFMYDNLHCTGPK